MKRQKKDHDEKIVTASRQEVEQYAGDASPGDAELPTTDQPAGSPPADAATDWKDKFLRAKADFQNMQRRSTKEQHTAVRYANADFARALLEVVDDLERTLEAGECSADDSLVAGVKLIYDKLMKVLNDHQVEPIEALGHPFEPQFHEALLLRPDDRHPPDTVIEQVQRGYKLHDRVLRPVRVVVSKSAAEPEQHGQTGGEE